MTVTPLFLQRATVDLEQLYSAFSETHHLHYREGVSFIAERLVIPSLDIQCQSLDDLHIRTVRYYATCHY